MKNVAEVKMVDGWADLGFGAAKCSCLILIFLSAVNAWSQGLDSSRANVHRDRMGRYGIPHLTEDQRKKIDALQTPLSKETLPLINQLAEKRAHLRTLQTADKTDLNSINATIDDISQLQAQLMKRRAAHTQAIRKLLNDDQRIAFDMKSERRFPVGRKVRNFHRRVG